MSVRRRSISTALVWLLLGFAAACACRPAWGQSGQRHLLPFVLDQSDARGVAYTWRARGLHILGAPVAVGEGMAWVLGVDGRTLKTYDRGATWAAVPTPGESLAPVAAPSATTAWAFGEVVLPGGARSRSGTLWRTEDGGATWRRQSAPSGLRFGGLSAPSVDVAWALGLDADGRVSGVLRTTDGGATWIARPAPPAGHELGSVTQLLAFSDTVAWALNLYPSCCFYTGSDLLQTRDGGVSWSLLFASCCRPIRGVVAASPDAGWLISECSSARPSAPCPTVDTWVHRSVDGGRTWTVQLSRPEVLSVAVGSRDVAWAVGAGGLILTTLDGGVTWFEQTSGVRAALVSVSAGSETSAFSSASDGTLLTTAPN